VTSAQQVERAFGLRLRGLRRNSRRNRDKLLPRRFVRLQARHKRFDSPALLVSQRHVLSAVRAAARRSADWLIAKEELAAVELRNRPSAIAVP
jgi:hypothetical protein